MVVKGEEFIVGGGGSNPSMALFFLNFLYFVFLHLIFFFIFSSFLIRKSSQMLINQTDVAVDEELEKVIITIYSSTETGIRDNESGYEFYPEKLKKPPEKQRRVYNLDFECILFRKLKVS